MELHEDVFYYVNYPCIYDYKKNQTIDFLATIESIEKTKIAAPKNAIYLYDCIKINDYYLVLYNIKTVNKLLVIDKNCRIISLKDITFPDCNSIKFMPNGSLIGVNTKTRQCFKLN